MTKRTIKKEAGAEIEKTIPKMPVLPSDTTARLKMLGNPEYWKQKQAAEQAIREEEARKQKGSDMWSTNPFRPRLRGSALFQDGNNIEMK